MRKLLLKICYDGTNYCGWQVQPNGITIQQILCNALLDLLGKETGVTGCSRTDSGVHAYNFCCHFETDNESISNKGFVGALNARLPDDISVIDCINVECDFHARYNAKAKQYIYKLYCSEFKNPFLEKYALRVSKPLDIDKINEFCKQVIGTHDFYAFSASGRSANTTVRTVYDCGIDYSDGIYTFYITGDGFLYNMVRILVGTALFVSEGKISPCDFEKIIESKERSAAGPTVPPYGLYLNKVYYDEGEIKYGIQKENI